MPKKTTPQREPRPENKGPYSQGKSSGKPWSRVAVDANFFILAFAQHPENLQDFKQIMDRVAFKLFTSPQVLKELRGSLRRRVQQIVEIVDVSNEELDDYIEKAKGLVDRIPQAPDLSLLLVLKKLKEQTLVSSDFHLLQSLRRLEPEIEGLMGSSFLLQLLELSHDDEESAALLEEIRERVLHTEIKYSLTRSSIYDPTTRIKLIENQAFHIVRSLRGPRIDEEDLIGMSAKEALGLLTFLQELRRRYSTFVHKIHEQDYREVLSEISDAREELYSHLVLLAWELAGTAHRKLMRQITPDMVLLNYLMALCHLYLGEQEDLVEAKKAIEECNRILLTVRPEAKDYRRLMIMTHLLRITINLVLEDYTSATMYFTLFQRKSKDWGFTREQATTQALYLALLVIRGEITSTEFPLITDSKEVIRFLVDLASLYFMLRRFDEAWRLLNQVIIITQYFDLYDAMAPTLRRMLLVFYAEGRKRKKEFIKLVKEIKNWQEKEGRDTNYVNALQRELSRTPKPTKEYFTDISLRAEDLHPDLLDWMTVIDRVDTVLLQGSILICRSWKLDWNVALLTQGVLFKERAKGGEQVRLGLGKFRVTPPPPSLKKTYRILALIHADPSVKSRIYVRGGQGSRLLQLGTILDNHI